VVKSSIGREEKVLPLPFSFLSLSVVGSPVTLDCDFLITTLCIIMLLRFEITA
jgi:hypothetical protein